MKTCFDDALGEFVDTSEWLERNHGKNYFAASLVRCHTDSKRQNTFMFEHQMKSFTFLNVHFP